MSDNVADATSPRNQRNTNNALPPSPPRNPETYDLVQDDDDGEHQGQVDSRRELANHGMVNSGWSVVATNAHEPVGGTDVEMGMPPVPPTQWTPSPPRLNTTQRQTNTELCIICLDNPVTTKLAPCNHSHFCETCAAMILAGAVHDPPECPLCRQLVTSHSPADRDTVMAQANDRPHMSRLADSFAYTLLTRQQHNILQDYHGSTPWY